MGCIQVRLLSSYISVSFYFLGEGSERVIIGKKKSFCSISSSLFHFSVLIQRNPLASASCPFWFCIVCISDKPPLSILLQIISTWPRRGPFDLLFTTSLNAGAEHIISIRWVYLTMQIAPAGGSTQLTCLYSEAKQGWAWLVLAWEATN